MSEELAQDENDAADDYEFDALQRRMGVHDDEEEGLGSAHGVRHEPASDDVVFEIGDQDSDEEEDPRKRAGAIRLSAENERAGLMSGGGRKDD
ncbi:hypothetical protein JB92DRAFT_2943851 [Gautieria morchelliformis]|nr:hypothetical protein JB92DRAFT_2943851 [Gautieria morchelliformis]